LTAKDTTTEKIAVAETTAVVEPVVVVDKQIEEKIEKKAEKKVEEVAKPSRFSRFRESGFFPATAAAIFLVFAIVYFGKVDLVNGFNAIVQDIQTFASTTAEDKTVIEEEVPGNELEQSASEHQVEQENVAQATTQEPTITAAAQGVETDKNTVENNPEIMRPQMMPEPKSLAFIRKAEPAWMAQRRAQADQYRDRQIAKAEQYRKQHQAKVDKMREASWNRFLTSLPPAEAQRIVQQRAHAKQQQDFVMKQMEDAKKRHIARVEQHKTYIKQRFGS